MDTVATSSTAKRLLHITHARQDDAWVRGVVLPALGLTEDQYRTSSEDNVGAIRLDDLEHAVRSCRYTLLIASSAARVDEWTKLGGVLAQHLSLEDGKPRLLVLTRDFDPASEQARELLPLRQRCLTCLDGSNDERRAAALSNLAARLAVTIVEEPPVECPYPGLRMFGAGDPETCFDRPDLFFGRDDEGRQVVERLRVQERVLLVGPSGCGKSSLVRARVLPALVTGEQPMPVIVRPDVDPDAALRTALEALDPSLSHAIDGYLAAEHTKAALDSVIAASSGVQRLVIIDQFEEVFFDPDDPDHPEGSRAAFFTRLAVLCRVPGVMLLLGMRADFYADLMRCPAWDDFKDHRVELAPLRGAGLRAAIVGPAERAGVHVEVDLVERLVREADLDRAAEALPLLQVALEQLWAHREWRYLSLDSYERIADGGRRGLDVVLARHADASIAVLSPPRQVLAHRVLLDLVHLGEGRPDTRRRRRAGELLRAGDRPDELTEVLAHLSAHRLIAAGTEIGVAVAARVVALAPLDDMDNEQSLRHVDLAHDTLITGWPSLARWVADRRDDLRTQRRLEARAAGGGLLAASELPEFLRWVDWIDTPAGQSLGATVALRVLVRRSVAMRRRRRIAFAGGLVTAVTFAIVFGQQTVELRTERTKTLQSISKAAETARMVVFEVDTKLRTVAGASGVRETLLNSARQLLAELRKLGRLDDRDQRTGAVGKTAEAALALEQGRLDEARALYLEALDDAQRRIAKDPRNTDWQHDLFVLFNKLGDVAVKAGQLDAARSWFEQALSIAKALTAEAPNDTHWQRELSVSFNRLGDVAAKTGQLGPARSWFEQSLVIRKSLAAKDPHNTDWQRAVAISFSKLGDIAVTTGQLNPARAWFEQALAIAKALAAKDPYNTDWQGDLSGSFDKLGGVAVTAGQLDAARSWFEQALAIHKSLAAKDPINTDWQRDLVTSFDRLGGVAVTAGQLDTARAWFEQALAIAKALAAKDPNNTDWQRDLAGSFDGLGEVAVTAGQLDAARSWFEQSLVVRKSLTAKDPNNTDWQRDLAISFKRVGAVAVTAGQLDAARSWFEQSLAIHESLAAKDANNTDWQRDLAISFERLGDVAVTAGQLDAARSWFEQSLAIHKALAAKDLNNAYWQRDLAVSLSKLGDLAINAGKLDAARSWFKQALSITHILATKDPSNTDWQRGLSISLSKLGDVAVKAGQFDPARSWFEQALVIGKSLAAKDPNNTEWQRDLSISFNKLGDDAIKAGKLDAARSWFEQALAIAKALGVKDPSNTDWQRDLSVSFNKLGDVAVKAGKVDLARSWFERALAITKALAANDPNNTEWQRDLSVSFNKLGDVAIKGGKLAPARSWFEQALVIRKALAAKDPNNTGGQRDLSLSFEKLGDVAVAAGQLDAARSWFEQALAISKALAAKAPNNTELQRDLAVSFNKLGDVAVKAGQLAAARTWFEQDLAITKALASAIVSPQAQYDLLVSHLRVALVLEARPKLAAPHIERADAIYDQLRSTGAFRGDAQFARIGKVLASQPRHRRIPDTAKTAERSRSTP